MTSTRRTSPRVASLASRVLRGGRYGKTVKTLAGSALGHAGRRRKRR